MIRKIIFICVALICKQDTLASVVMGSRPDFKDDADEVRVRLEIIPSGQKTGYGEIDPSGYEEFLTRISRMKQLRSLSVSFVRVPNAGFVFPIERLTGLTNLNCLAIFNHGTNPVKVTSIALCKAMPLKELDLRYVEVGGEDSVRDFKRLESLSCSSGDLFRFAPSGLRSLAIENAEVKGELELSRFYQLETLQLINVKCSSIQGLSSLNCLESLFIYGIPVGNLSEIKSCARLKSLVINDCMNFDDKFDIANLKSLPLKDVEIRNCPLSRIQGLEKCPLENLWIDGTGIQSLNDICSLPKLKFLDIASDKIHLKGFEDIEHVKELFPNLERMTLKYYDSVDKEIKIEDIDLQGN